MAYCETCLLGHSPAVNRIVLCDSCNTPYHQLCHTPPITDSAIAAPDSMWFCARCEAKRSLAIQTPSWDSSITGRNYPRSEKEEWLSGLPHRSLIALLQNVESRYPDVRLYPPDLPKLLVERRERTKAEQAENIARRLELDRLKAEQAAKVLEQERSSASVWTESRASSNGQNMKSRPAGKSILASTPYDAGEGNERPQNASGSSISQNLRQRTASSPGATSDQILDEPSPTPPMPESEQLASTLPSYEEMIVTGLLSINDFEGTPPRTIFQWMSE